MRWHITSYDSWRVRYAVFTASYPPKSNKNQLHGEIDVLVSSQQLDVARPSNVHFFAMTREKTSEGKPCMKLARHLLVVGPAGAWSS